MESFVWLGVQQELDNMPQIGHIPGLDAFVDFAECGSNKSVQLLDLGRVDVLREDDHHFVGQYSVRGDFPTETRYIHCSKEEKQNGKVLVTEIDENRESQLWLGLLLGVNDLNERLDKTVEIGFLPGDDDAISEILNDGQETKNLVLSWGFVKNKRQKWDKSIIIDNAIATVEILRTMLQDIDAGPQNIRVWTKDLNDSVQVDKEFREFETIWSEILWLNCSA